MRSIVLLLVLFFLTALLLTATTKHCKAQYSGTATINADGGIDPSTAPIQRVGDTYTLTSDIGGISVQRSNIILDGNSHTLSGSIPAATVFLNRMSNVTVKNLIVRGGGYGIFLNRCLNVTVSGNTITGTHVPIPEMQPTGGIYVWGGGSHTIRGNHIADNMGGIYLGYGTEHNIIVDNNITGNTLGGMSIWESSNNTIYHNSFVNNTVQVYNIDSGNTWDDGAKGNYWSDYNGTDANNDGIGDTPYVIDANNVDNYPLMYPYDIEKNTIAFPTPEPQLEPEPFPTTLVVALIASVAVIGVGLLVYFKKRNR